MAKGDYKTKATGFLLGFARRRIEVRLEQWLLETCRKYPFIRQTYEQLGKDATLDLIGGLINLLPEPDSSTAGGLFKQFVIDFAEVMPRELGRILDERRDLVSVPGAPGSGGPRVGITSADVLKLLEADLMPHFEEFWQFYSELTPRHREALNVILAQGKGTIVSFLAKDRDARKRMLEFLVARPVPPSEYAARNELRARWLRCGTLWNEVIRLYGEADRLRPVDRVRAAALDVEGAELEEEFQSLASTLPGLQAEIFRMRREMGSFADSMPQTNAALRGALEGFRRRHPR